MALVLASAAAPQVRRAWRRRTPGTWILDGANLVAQGLAIPLLETSMVCGAWARWAPHLRGAWVCPHALAFAVNFVLVDYLYYWNHRMLHRETFWPLHRVHHSAEVMDVFATSRNTLWTSLLIVYVWINGCMIYLLHDPRAYLAAASLTAVMDLWRHASVPRVLPGWIAAWLGQVFILPSDHARHHARDGRVGNYGANLKLWDRLHGTALLPNQEELRLGRPVDLPWFRQLLWPVR